MNKTWIKHLTVWLIVFSTALGACAIAESAETTIILPAELQIIEEEVFADTAAVKHVVVPDGALEIGPKAFAGSGLQTIRLPESLTLIAEDAFEGLTDLTAFGVDGSYAQEYCEEHHIPFSTYVQAPYPESAHPYEPGVEQTWHWQGDENAKSLRITFGENCELSGDDSITLYDQYGNWVYRYYDTDLQGRSKVISGNAFSITLLSYSDTPAYGFDIVSIEEDYVNQPVTISDVSAETSYADGWTEMTWTVDTEGTYLPLSYQYMVLLYGNRHYTENSTSNVFSYKVENSADYGRYSLGVKVTDAQDNTLNYYDDEQIEVEEVHYEMLYVTPDVTSIPAGNTITWSAEAQSTAYQLTYTHILEKDGVEIARQSDARPKGEPASFSYAALEPGVYTLTVEADKWGSVISLASVPVVVTDYVVLPEEDFTYTMLSETEVEITGYTGTSAAMIIPETIAGASVVSIGTEAFRGNTGINVLILPDTVTAIGNSAFRECTNLQKVDLGQGVSQIGHYAFQQCPNISSIDFPASVTSLGSAVFSGCTGLSHVGYPVNLASAGEQIFIGCTSLKTIEIPYGVTSLPAYVFSGASYLEKVTLPETLVFVGYKAFGNCTSLQEATLPDSVEQICGEAFLNCTSLASFHYPLNWTNWVDDNGRDIYATTNILGGCPLITTIEVPEGVTHIPEGAFESCEYLQEVTLPSTLVKIDHRAFRNCTGITEMDFPDGLLFVGGKAFEGCTNLAEAVLPDSVETILQGAFHDCSALTSFHYPMKWTTAYDAIFDSGWGYDYSWGQILAGCPLITVIDIPEGVKLIPDYAFSRCESLVDVHFPDGLIKVGYMAFEDCTSLIEADLPDSVEHIEGGAFCGCTSLELFHYPLSWWTSETGFDWEGSPISDCPLITTLEVPEGITLIPDKALRSSNYLEEVILPSTLVEIGEKSFAYCERLSTLHIPASVQIIGKDAFKNCPNLYLSCDWDSAAHSYAEDNGLTYNYLTLSGGIYPEGTLYQGDDFTFHGYLHSKQTVTHLSVGIYDMDGDMLQGTAVTPNATSIRLKTAIGDAIDLSTLELGTYRFQLKATAGEEQKTVVDSTFIITLPPARVEKTGMTSPSGLLIAGKDFNIKGTLTANKVLQSVTVSIENEPTGLMMRQYEDKPNAKTFDVSTAADAMEFAKLPEGSYIYRITVVIDDESQVEEESRFKLYAEESQRAQQLNESLRGSTSVVNNNLLYESVLLANAAYHEKDQMDAMQAVINLKALGFQDIQSYSLDPGKHTIGHFIGWKDMVSDDGTTTRAYAIICRGTAPDDEEWRSDFTFEGNPYYHYGFYEAAIAVRDNYLTYVEAHKPADRETTDCKLWITGHSRGAAVANLLGGTLLPNEGYDRSSTFVYTFACPLVTTAGASGGYNIFNYNIGGDIVPRVPLASWGYSRFGTTTTLENGSYAFGKDLIEIGAMDYIEEVISESVAASILHTELTDVLNQAENYNTNEILPELLGAVIDLLSSIKSMNWKNVIDTFEIFDVYPTHEPGTYVQWISSIT